MTKEELQDRISYLERALQRKAEQVASDERAITKSEGEVNKLEQLVTKSKTSSQLKSAQSRLKAKKDERQRKMKTRDAHKKEQNNISKQLLTAKQQFSEFDENLAPLPTVSVSPIDKIYQIFVSSTYEDLKLERQEVMAAVVSTGNVPVGMEYFPAGDASPFDYIKQQIDSVDYYILIVAGKYGSINTETGISYTEMEFNYAVENKVPIAVLQYKDIKKLTGEKLEIDDPKKRRLLEAFRKKSKEGRVADFWESPVELRMKVKDAIQNLIKNSPRTGWVRADQVTLAKQEDLDLELLNKVIPVSYDNSLNEWLSNVENENQTEKITLANVLDVLVPYLRNPSYESVIDDTLKKKYGYLSYDTIERIKVELLKHRLVETNPLIMQDNGAYTVWTVTKKGMDLWLEIVDES